MKELIFKTKQILFTLTGKNKSTSIKEFENKILPEVRRNVFKLKKYINNSSVVFDIGANTGLFTEEILSLYPKAKLHLFEPVTEYFLQSLNKFQNNKNVTINNYALADKKDIVEMWVDRENLGWNTMVSKKRTYGMRSTNVPMDTLDNYCSKNKIDKIDLIKIDVEGAEYRVIEGMKKTIKKLHKKPLLFVEVGWGKNQHPFWDREVECFEWLFKNGYKRFDYNGIDSTKDILIKPL